MKEDAVVRDVEVEGVDGGNVTLVSLRDLLSPSSTELVSDTGVEQRE